MCTHNYVYMYVTEKKIRPPNIKHLPTPLNTNYKLLITFSPSISSDQANVIIPMNQANLPLCILVNQ